MRICREFGIKVGIRFTINRRNYHEIPAVFDFIEEEGIPRACFYHLVYSGRGSKLMKEDLDHEETRNVVDIIMDRTRDLFERGKEKEILTVDNHADGPYILKCRSRSRASSSSSRLACSASSVSFRWVMSVETPPTPKTVPATVVDGERRGDEGADALLDSTASS